MSQSKNIFCAIDLGSFKVTVAIAEVVDGNIKILGVSQKDSKGISRGMVINIDSASEIVRLAIEEAQDIAGVEVNDVYLGFTDLEIRGFNSLGIAAVEGAEISTNDLAMAIKTARAVPLSSDREVIHVLQQDFVVDGQSGVFEPVGMFGVRLESNVHIVVASSRVIQNIQKCINNCGVTIKNFVVEQLASSYAVLSKNEKDMGVCMIDIGAGTINMAVFINGVVCRTHVLSIAGNVITSDISKSFKIPIDLAETIKLQYGCATARYIKNPDEKIDIPASMSRLTRRLSVHDLALVIEARVEEVLYAMYNDLDKRGLLELISAGIVLTGGGSRLKGLAQVTEDVFKLPVRIGGPVDVIGANDILHNPSYSTIVGLLQYMSETYEGVSENIKEVEKTGMASSVKGWFSKHF